MKQYKFRLQTVLEMKTRTLEDKRLEMAKVIKLLNEYQEKYDEMVQSQGGFKNDFDGFSSDGEINVFEIANYQGYLVKLNEDIKKQWVLIDQTKNLLKLKQKAVNEALKDVKVLEKLKENQSKRFYKSIEKKEENEIDDIVTARYKQDKV